jgi:hypothetical protein
MNARKELVDHIGERKAKYVHVVIGYEFWDDPKVISGTLPEVLPLLDVEYCNGHGMQELFGNIWYEDGSWSERNEYDGSEWWEHKVCPEIPNSERIDTSPHVG